MTGSEPIEMKQPEYPYGLHLRLENEQIEKLGGLKGITVGNEVKINAMGKVTSIRKEEYAEGKDNNCLEIQITDIDISSDSEYENAFNEANKKDK